MSSGIRQKIGGGRGKPQPIPRLIVAILCVSCNRNGRTNLAAALRVVRTNVFTARRGARASAAKVVVVMTTTPSFNETDTVDEAMRLRADGVSIIGVGIGRSVSRSELDGVVSYPVSRNAFYVDRYSQLNNYIRNVTNSQCNGMYSHRVRLHQAYRHLEHRTFTGSNTVMQPKDL